MEKSQNYEDNLKERRDFFQRNFPMLKIAERRRRENRNHYSKNTCPVCGYWTLEARDIFDICGICFWEDDGLDDFEENEDSEPNYMTLKKGRLIFREAKSKLMTTDNFNESHIAILKEIFIKLDNKIEEESIDKEEIIRLQAEIIDLLAIHNVYGIEKLFIK